MSDAMRFTFIWLQKFMRSTLPAHFWKLNKVCFFVQSHCVCFEKVSKYTHLYAAGSTNIKWIVAFFCSFDSHVKHIIFIIPEKRFVSYWFNNNNNNRIDLNANVNCWISTFQFSFTSIINRRNDNILSIELESFP